MSPTRRSLIQTMVAASVTTALPAGIAAAAAQPSIQAQLDIIRTHLLDIHAVVAHDDVVALCARTAIYTIDDALDALCPHSLSAWIGDQPDPVRPWRRRHYCPHCRVWISWYDED